MISTVNEVLIDLATVSVRLAFTTSSKGASGYLPTFSRMRSNNDRIVYRETDDGQHARYEHGVDLGIEQLSEYREGPQDENRIVQRRDDCCYSVAPRVGHIPERPRDVHQDRQRRRAHCDRRVSPDLFRDDLRDGAEVRKPVGLRECPGFVELSDRPKALHQPITYLVDGPGGAGPTGGPDGPSMSFSRTIYEPSLVLCTRASSCPSSASLSPTAPASRSHPQSGR